MATITKRTSQKTGNVSYRVKVRLKGHPTATNTFKRKTDAEIWASQTETAIRENRYFRTAKSQKHTFGEMIERYQNEYLKHHPKREAGLVAKLNGWKKELGCYTLADVTKARILEQRSKLLNTPKANGAQRANGTVNRLMASLSHVYTIAIREWEWIEDSPFRKIAKLPEPRGRVRFLDDNERRDLLGACKESGSMHLYLVVMIALSTGARQGEILGLKWQDVDLQRRIITLHHTKNGERRILPISNILLPLIHAHYETRSLHSDYVFPSPRSNCPLDIRSAWDNAVIKAKIKDFRFHDLRHSAASYFAMNGATSSEIGEILGHKTPAMVKRYAHLSPAHTAGVVERMNDKVFG
jgi:integrase